MGAALSAELGKFQVPVSLTSAPQQRGGQHHPGQPSWKLFHRYQMREQQTDTGGENKEV